MSAVSEHPGPAEGAVLVAMSGGVDSSAAALLLVRSGSPVIGVSMQVWDYRHKGGNATRATCCAPADFDDARVVAQRCNFPFYVFDFEDSFKEAVIDPFVASYLRGETPNPCVECNRRVKFKALRRRARSLGAKAIATGHYAQVKPLPDGSLGLFTAVDREKDQSYFLYALTQEELRETLFPVGRLTKREVRRVLADEGLQIASKAESQDICFVSSSVSEFIEERADTAPTAGRIVTRDGRQLGSHAGVHRYTVGQRKGIGSGSAHPLYVLDIDPEQNVVTVGAREELERKEFRVRDVNWINGEPAAPFHAVAKLRYRHHGVACEIAPEGEHCARVSFLSEWAAVSPGQAAVFYRREADEAGDFQILGGGTIERGLQ